MEEKSPLRWQPDDHHFWSVIMLCRDCGGFPAGNLGSRKGALLLSSRGSDPLKADWQRHVLASSGYLDAGGYQLLWDDDPRLK